MESFKKLWPIVQPKMYIKHKENPRWVDQLVLSAIANFDCISSYHLVLSRVIWSTAEYYKIE